MAKRKSNRKELIYKEVNPMALYRGFDRGSAVHRIMQYIRKSFIGILDGDPSDEFRTIDNRLIKKAKDHVYTVRRELDASTFPFAHDLNKAEDINELIFQGEKTEIVMLADGRFDGDRGSIESILPIRITPTSYKLFRKGQSYPTIDECVTSEQTTEFLRNNKNHIIGAGYNSFYIDRSSFFYLKRSDYERLSKVDGKIDMAMLVRFLVPTEGYHIVLESVQPPPREEYMELAPLFVSYRLKTSLTDKLLMKLRKRETPSVIKDWVAHRINVENIGYVKELHKFFKESPQIGKSKVTYLFSKDKYSDPSERGEKEYKGLAIAVEVQIGRRKPSIREIQIIDKGQYWENELEQDVKSHRATFHRSLERKRTYRPSPLGEAYDYYKKVLTRIFGSEAIKIDLNKL